MDIETLNKLWIRIGLVASGLFLLEALPGIFKEHNLSLSIARGCLLIIICIVSFNILPLMVLLIYTRFTGKHQDKPMDDGSGRAMKKP
jgi:uncharacterized membrane protein